MLHLVSHIEVFRSKEDGFLYGRPVNPYKQSFVLPGFGPDITFSNRLYREFEDFAKDLTFQMYSNEVAIGIYPKSKVRTIAGALNVYYVLTN